MSLREHGKRHAQPSPMASCSIRHIALTRFRNYRSAHMALEHAPIMLTGHNGAGKTNILEAVSLLRPGRGLRGATAHELAFTDMGAQGGMAEDHAYQDWGINVSLYHHHLLTECAVIWQKDAQGGWRVSRKVKGHDHPSRYVESIPILWLMPGTDRHSNATRSLRRQFIDHIISVVDYDHKNRLTRYERLMRERRHVLWQKGYVSKTSRQWLSSLENAIAQDAVAIAASRKCYIEAVNASLQRHFFDMDVKTQIRVDGFIENALDDKAALEVEQHFVSKLEETRAHDCLYGGCEEGVHRSDMVMMDSARDIPASLCSTGQQKLLTLCLLLASAYMLVERHKRIPLLLLDEVRAHLDKAHASMLFAKILALDVQAWMSGLTPSLFSELKGRGQGFHVDHGCLVPW
ncbi:MAG: hypothetical protein GDA54_01275 [Alphaproteobacteria bacterium GM7ARS4]|nr:hypothetical protein [Alphaproteobacteria bacterium GM7ARS4]